MISSEEYQARRTRFMQSLGAGVAVLCSAPPAVMHHDVDYPYRQNSDFYYLTGFNEPDAVAVFAPHHKKHQYVLFVRDKDPQQEQWSGYRVGVKGAEQDYGADKAYPISQLDAELPAYLQTADQIYYHFSADDACNQRMIKHWQRIVSRYAKQSGPQALADPGLLLHPLRAHKSPAELALMRRAAEISALAHQQALALTRPGCYEYQIQAEIEAVFRREGADGPAYGSIVAGGANACVLHYVDNNARLVDGDLLLIDAACACGYYNADITRTFPINGRFNRQQRALYSLVLKAQTQAIAAIHPGTTYAKINDIAAKVIIKGLIELDLLRGRSEELLKQGAHKPFYMHSIGHWLGLDVHDVGVYQQGKKSAVLAPGQVLTIEPGLYFAPTLKVAKGQPKIDAAWRGIGIRIEDDILVTDTGHEVLTAAAPKSLAAMERRLES